MVQGKKRLPQEMSKERKCRIIGKDDIKVDIRTTVCILDPFGSE
jgi:hypothetical protein